MEIFFRGKSEDEKVPEWEEPPNPPAAATPPSFLTRKEDEDSEEVKVGISSAVFPRRISSSAQDFSQMSFRSACHFSLLEASNFLTASIFMIVAINY